jgi:hypothetical protein
MAIRFIPKYDMDPVYESDEVVFSAMRREERKQAAATIKLLLDQEHATRDGKEVESHLIAVPKGMQVPALIQAVFSLDINGRTVARGPWRPISDKGVTDQYPAHNVYWLCRARDHSAKWTQGMIEAILAPDAAAPKPREIKKEVAIKF